MKVRNILLWLIILLPSILVAQHEVKTDLLRTALKSPSVNLDYELIIKKFGFEIELIADARDAVVPDFTPTNSPLGFEPNFTSFNPSRFTTNFTGKYYFRKNGWKFTGLFIGPSVGFTFLTDIDPAAIEKYQEENRTDIVPNFLTKGINEFNLGIRLGYKYLIKSSFVVEASIRIFENGPVNSSGSRGFRFATTDVFALFKVGYRFGTT